MRRRHAGEGEYILVFIPWFWQREYRKAPPVGFVLTPDEAAYQKLYSLDLEQMAWRRAKITELNGVHNFRREYPATPEEAFAAEVPGALWKRSQIDNLRISRDKMPELARVVVAVDPSGGDKARNDEVGIIGAGTDAQKHGFVLEDELRRYTPESGAGGRSRCTAAQGGQDYRRGEFRRPDGRKHVIRTVDPNAPVKLVHA